MKYLTKILIGFCVLLAISSKAQNPLYFDKYYNTGYNNVLSTSILKNNDSTYSVLNYVRDSITGQQNPTILKIDKYGNFILNRTYNFNCDYLAYINGTNHFIDATPYSMFITAATYTSALTTIVINKINKITLDTIANTFYNDGLYSYYLSSILKIHSNKFFLVGNKSNSTTTWPVFIEIDSNAVIKNTITASITQSLSTKSAYYDTISKKITLSGWRYGNVNSYSFIAIADTLGNILDTFINNTSDHGIAKVVYNPYDNSFITIGSKTTSVYGNTAMTRIHITKYDINLNMLWQKTYGKANMVNMFRDAVVNADGSVVLVGSYSDSVYLPVKNVNCNGVILKVNVNGDSLWMREFDNVNNTVSWNNTYFEAFIDVEKTPEGGYIMCGNPQQHPKGQAWVVKTDSMGCILSNCATTNIKEQSIINDGRFNIYPNPTSGSFKINLGELVITEDLITISVTNLLGQIVFNQTLPTNSNSDIEIKGDKLSKGIYIVGLLQNNKNMGQGKLVIE